MAKLLDLDVDIAVRAETVTAIIVNDGWTGLTSKIKPNIQIYCHNNMAKALFYDTVADARNAKARFMDIINKEKEIKSNG